MSDLNANLFVLMQKALPKHLLTSVVHALARVRIRWVKDFLIRQFVKAYNVNIEEVARPVPDGFESFNAFFVRALHDDARVVDAGRGVIVSPVDGTISAAGTIEKDQVFQAKGLRYSLADLLATDTGDVGTYVDGGFATIYLAPHNYHRVHAPYSGELVAARYVPGDLFSVNDATVARLPGLFVRNERLVCHMKTAAGPMVLILVGALNVGSISTTWTGEIRPRKTGVVEQFNLDTNKHNTRFEKGDGLGWFNMGSTVVLLTPAGTTEGLETLVSGQPVTMGQAIGRLTNAS